MRGEETEAFRMAAIGREEEGTPMESLLGPEQLEVEALMLLSRNRRASAGTRFALIHSRSSEDDIEVQASDASRHGRPRVDESDDSPGDTQQAPGAPQGPGDGPGSKEARMLRAHEAAARARGGRPVDREKRDIALDEVKDITKESWENDEGNAGDIQNGVVEMVMDVTKESWENDQRKARSLDALPPTAKLPSPPPPPIKDFAQVESGSAVTSGFATPQRDFSGPVNRDTSGYSARIGSCGTIQHADIPRSEQDTANIKPRVAQFALRHHSIPDLTLPESNEASNFASLTPADTLAATSNILSHAPSQDPALRVSLRE